MKSAVLETRTLTVRLIWGFSKNYRQTVQNSLLGQAWGEHQ